MQLRAMMLATVAGALASSLSGCYVETLDDRPPGAPGEEVSGETEDRTQGNCRRSLGKGCFDGHVVAKKEFYVEGTQYFNADDLAAHFENLVAITDEKGAALTAGKDYQLKLVTPVDNQSFAQGFEYYLTGDTARTGKMRSTGDFSINDLGEGTYDLRVLKAIRFNIVREVEREVPAPADQPDAAPTIEKVTLTTPYCATLYADTVLEVRRGERAWGTFGDFRLHATDKECSAQGNQTTIALTP
jgi:hypothetical protein